MLLALSRRYVCRTRTRSNHVLYLLLSQFSSSSGSTRSPSVTSSAQGQGTIYPTPFSSNKDCQSHNKPSFPRKHPLVDGLFWMDFSQVHNKASFWRKHPLLDPLLETLRSFEEEDDNGLCSSPHFADTPTNVVDYALTVLHCRGFQPSDLFVLQVLSAYGNGSNNEPSLASYLAIFEWAGEQPDFRHLPKTFDSLNTILAGLNPILLKDLANVLDYPILLKDLVNVLGFNWYRVNVLGFDHYRACFYNSLLVANLIARKPGRLSHILVSLKSFNTPTSYNALVNVLLQHKMFAEADAVLHSMFTDGHISLEPNNIIRTTPNLGGPNQWDQANREYLRGLVHSGNQVEGRFLGGHALITLVSDHCKNKRFKDAADLIDEFKELSSFNSNYPYEVWIKSACSYAECCSTYPKVAALSDQMQTVHEACNPDVLRYNMSLFRLAMENRFEEVSQLLMEMKELQFMPRKPSVSVLMCYLIKAGALHIAHELYKLRPESQSSMRPYFLLNLLCGCGYESVVEAEHNHNKTKTCCILAGAPHCCKEGNFDRLIQLLRFRNQFRPRTPQLPRSFRNFLYNKLISALCLAGRVEDAYLLYGEFNLTRRKVFDGQSYYDEVTSTTDETYYHMIYGFRRINREDVAARLLLEMHEPS